MMTDHVCPVTAGAGGLIEESWCFGRMADVLGAMPPITVAADVLRPELLLYEQGPLSIRYCPFDSVNPGAKLVIIGITPGLRQMFLSCQEAQQALFDGQTGAEVLRRARAVGGFAGTMQTNLVAMLDGIGLPAKLDIDSTRSLFGGDHAGLLSGTSAVIYPTFMNGKNYSGTPSPESHPLLSAFVDQVLTAGLAMVPDAFVIPLGKTVAKILRREVERGSITAERCLFEFPHPSGANGHRASSYLEHRERMAAQVAKWAI
jgi:uracil-DNA glycosylase